MEMPGIDVYGNSIFQLRDSPTLSVMREVSSDHTTKTATRTKNACIL